MHVDARGAVNFNKALARLAHGGTTRRGRRQPDLSTGPGAGHTAPSAHNGQEIGVYAALADGIYRYDAAGHALQLAASGDVRSLTGVQDVVGQAPLDLVYVADSSRMSDADAEEHTFFAAADAGAEHESAVDAPASVAATASKPAPRY